MELDKNNTLLFSLTANKELAKEIATGLGIETSPSLVSHYADGEILAKPLINVEGKTCIVVQSSSTPVDDNLFEIFIFVDALRNANAGKIILVIPYFGYSRQDRVVNAGDPVTTKLVAKFFETAGANKIVCVDMHSLKMLDFFSIPAYNVETYSAFGEYYKKYFTKRNISLSDVVIVAPDKGGINRSEKLAKEMGDVPVTYISKHRPKANVAEVKEIKGDVNGKYCVMVDDIIDTGGTIVAGAKCLYEHGAKEVFVGASHGVFSNNAINHLIDANIKDIVTLDSIENNDIRINVIHSYKLFVDILKKII